MRREEVKAQTSALSPIRYYCVTFPTSSTWDVQTHQQIQPTKKNVRFNFAKYYCSFNFDRFLCRTSFHPRLVEPLEFRTVPLCVCLCMKFKKNVLIFRVFSIFVVCRVFLCFRVLKHFHVDGMMFLQGFPLVNIYSFRSLLAYLLCYYCCFPSSLSPASLSSSSSPSLLTSQSLFKRCGSKSI